MSPVRRDHVDNPSIGNKLIQIRDETALRQTSVVLNTPVAYIRNAGLTVRS